MKKLKIPFKIISGLFTLCLFSFFVTPAFAQMDDNYRNFRDWDVNDNQQLSYSEFYDGASDIDVFKTWDDDDNGVLEEQELNSGIYKKWENAGEDFETRDEARVRTWARYYGGTFDDWDTNGDGTITNKEFGMQVGDEQRKNMADKMDINNDGRVGKEEFYTAIFKMWDENEDNAISEQEYNPDELASWFL